ncbi:perlucin-like [Pecten maximus]|uniref:perlucin-like n=1 Tax=Pecten maximus TaxID=6579 RepID=UPI00145908FE|nr:perlucin-like [Pecten maximus]
MACILRLGAVLAAIVLHVIQGCPNGWESFDDSCYFVSDMREDWSAASNTCRLYHAHLVEIENEHEDNYLKQIITKYHYGQVHDRYFWLGGTDSFVESDWKWIESDKRLTYTNWLPGEPNDHHGEDCLVAELSGSRFFWRDQECTSKFNFVCEIGGDSSGSGIVIG